MARRRKRFRGLEATLKNLKHATTGILDPSSIPAGSAIKNYVDFRSGVTTLSYTRTPDSKPGISVKQQLVPFSVDAADPAVVVRISTRAFAAIGTDLGPTKAILKLDDVTTGRPLRGFAPAIGVFFKDDASQVATLEESQITGKRYNPREGRSYTLPFGQLPDGVTAADTTFAGRATAIIGALTAGVKVSFQPERYPMG